MPTSHLLFAVAALLSCCLDDARCEQAPAPRPISVQEFSLLLRSGYTGDEALKETAGRPLLTAIDAAAEHTLLDAGADARTVAALRDSRRVVSSTEADDARQQQAATERFRLEAWEAEQARRVEAARQTTRAKLAARRDDQLGKVAASLRGKLVVCRDGRVEPGDPAALAGKTLFLLYAAGADKASRQLTPQLAEFYKRFAPAHPEFELVLVSTDRSAADMEKSMKQAVMPWPALAFGQLAQQPDLASLGKEAVPRLVLIDGSGVKIADNVENGKPLDANRVIDALVEKTGTAAAPTAAR